MSKQLEDQQFILATISIDEFAGNPLLKRITTHKLTDKLSLLRKAEYESVRNEIEHMHSETLASTE
jgi:hypothetical protein